MTHGMKRHWAWYFAAPAVLLLLASASMGNKPLRVGGDEITSCFQAWVDVSGNSTPSFSGGEGLVLVDLIPLGGSSNLVITPSGKMNFHCAARLPLGEQVEAVDIVTGQTINATLATHSDACNAIREVSPDACRGRGGPFMSTYETVGVECTAAENDPPFTTYFTQDWISVTTHSGQSSINCHFDDVFPEG